MPDPWEGRFWLTDAMARTAGVSLSQSIARGQIGRSAAAELLERCAQCTKEAECLLHLVQDAGGDGGEVPSYCLNRETIEALRARR